METILNLLVALCLLSGFYLALGTACALIERLPRLAAARPRRARTRTGHGQQRGRSARPRRRQDGAEDPAGVRHPATLKAVL